MTTLVFTVDFKHCCRISNTHRILKIQISIFTDINHGYVLRLTHIFVACKTPCYTQDNSRVDGHTAADLNCFAAEIHC